MNVACPECRSVFRIDPAKVAGTSVRARCSVCSGIIPVSASVAWGDDFPDQLLAKPTGAPRRGTATPRATASAAQVERGALRSSASATPKVSVAASAPPPLSMNRREPSAPPPPAEPLRPHTGPSAFGSPTFPASALRPPTPSYSPSVPTPTVSAQPDASASLPSSSTPRRSTPFSTPAQGAAVAATAPAPARRLVNPFLSNDPNQKARRLARALVSDMVAYNPLKREEGARNGSLKSLFRDEIKKSYEEYVEQVGREFAEATSHFQDALNEVLAQGKRLF